MRKSSATRFPAGQITTQLPPAGQTVEAGGTVRVAVSRGSRERTLPEIAGMTADEAWTTLEREGFVMVAVDTVNAEVELGHVIGYADNAAGDTLAFGSVVSGAGQRRRPRTAAQNKRCRKAPVSRQEPLFAWTGACRGPVGSRGHAERCPVRGWNVAGYLYIAMYGPWASISCRTFSRCRRSRARRPCADRASRRGKCPRVCACARPRSS